MIITNKLIESHNPCEDGILDFNTKYPEYSDTLINLLKLNDISYSNKLWLVTKVVDIKILQQWSVDCAESVLHNYNELYPNDNRVSECIETTKLYLEGKCSLDELIRARLAASLAAYSASSAYSASLAAYSAYSASSASSASSAYSAVRLAASSAVRSAASSAVRSASGLVSVISEEEQEDLNISLLIGLL